VPEGISSASIERVLATLKPDSAVRSRDRSVLLLLATYGPRTGQISDLQLGDVAWRAREITFCAQKRSRAVRHALTPAVAEALALYLREHRPHAEHDHVFVRHRGPSSPLTPTGVRGLVAYRLREAGIDGGLLSPRAFRYALATRLLEARHPYKLIADTFGHQSMRATAVYTKMNRPFLEEAAAEWQEPAR
jgi:integrase